MRNSTPFSRAPARIVTSVTRTTSAAFATLDLAAAPVFGLVFGAVLLVHGRSAGFGLTGLDDEDLLTDDAAFLRGPVNLLRIFTRSYMHVVDPHHPYYRPLVTASFALDAHGPGHGPLAYHVTNLLVHACASLLFLRLLRRFAMGAAATAGALVFAVHPALAAAVAWIPGRNDSLLALFVLAAWQFLPFEGFAVAGGPPPPARNVGWHLVFFAFALLTKETALVAPVVWGLHLALQAKANATNATSAPNAPHTAATTRRTVALVTGWIVLITARLALAEAPHSLIRAQDALGFPSLLVRSLGALVFPFSPSLLSDAVDLPLALGLAALALAALSAWRVPGVRPRTVAIGAAAYVVFLVPAFFAGTSLLLSTRLYLPACGIVIAATEVLRPLVDRPEARRSALSFAFVTAAVFALFSLAYESSFANRRRFAHAEADAAPHCGMAHFCLGASYQMDGDQDRALGEYRSALAFGAVEVVHNNIAVIEMGRDLWPAAEADLREEIARNPGYARAYRNLAIVLRREGRATDAASAEERAATLEGAPAR